MTAKKPATSKARVYYDHPSGPKPQYADLYQFYAQRLDIQPQALRALAVVESDEKPFTPGGAPVVRLEIAHWKRNRLATKPALAFDRCINAMDLDVRWAQFQAMHRCQPEAAILSHSFGMFQVMGFNHKACLCATPEAFLAEMMSAERQFEMVARLILSSPDLLSALRRQDAAKVAFHYNGSKYAANRYDVRWAAAAKAGGDGVWT